jgi:hypothetical protein
LTDLCGGEAPRRQFWITETDFDFDDAVPPYPGTHGERQLEEGELEMLDLQPFRRDGDFPIGGKACPTEAAAEDLSGLDSGNDDDWSLNSEHADLFNEHAWRGPSGQSPGAAVPSF